MKIIPFLFFVLAMTATPGPGNITMMAIGQTTGFVSSLPFLAGSAIGFLALNICVALGIGELMTASSVVDTVLKTIGTIYIVYLAGKIMKTTLSRTTTTEKRFSFVEGIFLHPSSPKSWAMSLVGISQFAASDATLLSRTVVFAGLLMAGQVCFHSLWCAAGATLMRYLTYTPVRIGVNTMAVLFMVGATGYALFL